MRMYLPTEARWEETRLGRFIAHNGFGLLEELQTWSLRNSRNFWRAVAEEVGLGCGSGRLAPRGSASWLEPAGFDVATSLLGRHAASAPRRLALCAPSLDGGWSERSFAELAEDTSTLAAGLAQRGVRTGDRVGVALPIGLEAVTTMLALLQLGAQVVWLGAMRDAARRLVATDCHWLVVAHERAVAEPVATTISFGSLSVTKPAPGTLARIQPARLELPGLPPQEIAGMTLKAAWDLAAALDLHEGDVLMACTGPSSPLWPWLVLGCLQLGAGLVVADRLASHGGQPPRVLPAVTHLGICGATLQSERGNCGAPAEAFDAGALRLVAIFDGRIDATAWNWLFEQIGHCRFPLVNCFGGPAWGGLLLAAFPGLPVKPCALVGPLPGVDLCLNIATGRPGGSLVCGNCWPGMPHPDGNIPRLPVRAWIDPDGYWFLD